MPYGLKGLGVMGTPWYCPAPGLPLSNLDTWLGCPPPKTSDTVYTTPPLPPANPAVPAAYGTVAAPYDCVANPIGNPSCPGFDAALAASTAAQKAAADAANQAFFAGIAKSAAQDQCPTSTLIDNGDGTWSCPAGSACFSLFNSFSAGMDTTSCLGPMSLLTWGLLGVGVWFFTNPRGGRR